MKKLFVFLFISCFTTIGLTAQSIDVEYLRKNYDKAAADKKLCSNMIEDLKAKKDNNVYLAYLGGLQTIWANHTMNPISKLQTFNEGKRNLEDAVERESGEIEIRFIRLSVQKNAPSFLGYNQHIEADENFIKTHKHSITSASLLQLINTL